MKSATKVLRGTVVDLARRTHLLDDAVAHHHDAVGDRQRLLEVVGDVHARDVQPALELLQLHAHLPAELGVEIRQRLVEEQHRGREHERPGQGDALLLPAGELRGAPRAEIAELDQLQRVAHARGHLGLGPLPHAEPVGHVVEHAHVGPDRVGLEHHRQPAPLGGHVHARRRREHRAPPDPDLTRGRPLEPGDGPERGRLAAARRPEQRHVLARADGEADSAHRHDGPVAHDEVAHLDGVPAPAARVRRAHLLAPGLDGAAGHPEQDRQRHRHRQGLEQRHRRGQLGAGREP